MIVLCSTDMQTFSNVYSSLSLEKEKKQTNKKLFIDKNKFHNTYLFSYIVLALLKTNFHYKVDYLLTELSDTVSNEVLIGSPQPHHMDMRIQHCIKPKKAKRTKNDF